MSRSRHLQHPDTHHHPSPASSAGEPHTCAFVLTAHAGRLAAMKELLGSRLLSHKESPYLVDGAVVMPHPDARHRVLDIEIRGTAEDLRNALLQTGGVIVGETVTYVKEREEIGFADELPEENIKEPAGEEQIAEIQHAIRQLEQPELDPSIEHYDQP